MLDALALGADGVLTEVSGAGVTGVTGVAATSKAFLLRLRWRLPCRDMCSLSLGDVDLLPELPRQRKAPANRVQRFRKGCSPQLSLRRPSSGSDRRARDVAWRLLGDQDPEVAARARASASAQRVGRAQARGAGGRVQARD